MEGYIPAKPILTRFGDGREVTELRVMVIAEQVWG